MIDISNKYLWAKTNNKDDSWHPLILHMIDVAASADAILAREPETTRTKIAEILGMQWDNARPWLLLVIACHDLGKACPGFQCKWPKNLSSTGLHMPKRPNDRVNHAYVSQIALEAILLDMGWPDNLAEYVAETVGCHHGELARQTTIDKIRFDGEVVGNDEWRTARRDIVESLIDILHPGSIPTKNELSGPEFILLAGLTSFADWIGSNEEWFPFGTAQDCDDLSGWFRKRRALADNALDALGWEPRTPLMHESRPFEAVFINLVARPLQQAVAEAVNNLIAKPSILLVEAPMGEGKTEAAFYAHLQMQRRFGHRGLYIALPTKATGNAMFERTLQFLSGQSCDRRIDLQLLHGATALNDKFQQLKFTAIHDDESGGEVRVAQWFTNKKRALLSEYGVGTVDQAIVPILPVRHYFVRMWGLANRVVIFDEIHAYDVYTGTLLLHLIRWLMALGSSVVLLSATLPASIRRELARIVNAKLPHQEAVYPRLSIFLDGEAVKQVHFDADPARRRVLTLKGISHELSSIYAAIEGNLPAKAMGLALVNTVQRAQELYRLFPEGEPIIIDGHRVGKRLADGTEVYLFHARYPADRRQKREDNAIASFGPDGLRDCRKILIATQVAEQSLDLDFDLLVTDLAPIDLVLQRAGRLWRHHRQRRPTTEPLLIVAGLEGDRTISFGEPLYWEKIYGDYLLLRTWSLLKNRDSITLPDEIDPLVQAVYEELEDVPEVMRERLQKASGKEEGDAYASKAMANNEIIGLPDDDSWRNDNFVLDDEDATGVHRSLKAKTRQGEESVTAIPLWPNDGFRRDCAPDYTTAKQWAMRSLNISRKDVIQKIRAFGVPEGWRNSPLLRDSFALTLDEQGRWVEDDSVRLDDELGLVYEKKETE